MALRNPKLTTGGEVRGLIGSWGQPTRAVVGVVDELLIKGARVKLIRTLPETFSYCCLESAIKPY